MPTDMMTSVARRMLWKSYVKWLNFHFSTRNVLSPLGLTRQKASSYMALVSLILFSRRRWREGCLQLPFTPSCKKKYNSWNRKNAVSSRGGESHRCLLHPSHRFRVSAEVRGRRSQHGSRALHHGKEQESLHYFLRRGQCYGVLVTAFLLVCNLSF